MTFHEELTFNLTLHFICETYSHTRMQNNHKSSYISVYPGKYCI